MHGWGEHAWGKVGAHNLNSGGMVGARGMVGTRLRHGLCKVAIISCEIIFPLAPTLFVLTMP